MDKKENLSFELEDTNFYKLLTIKDSKELYDEIVKEIMIDIDKIDVKREKLSEDDFLLLAFPYTGKYGLLVYNYEIREEYEYCNKVKNLFVECFAEAFEIEPLVFTDLLFTSIKMYNENNALKDILND